MHLTRFVAEDSEPQAKESVQNVLGTACFDARLFEVVIIEEALNCLLWRCKGDAVRNSVNAFARTMFSVEEMHGKSVKELLRMMAEKGVVYEKSVPKWALEGSLVKNEQYEHEGVNLKTGNKEVALRTRFRVEDRGITVFSKENLRLVSEKFW